MGYEVVEFYSPYFNWTPTQAKDVRKLLDDLGIKCLSTHNSAQAIAADGMDKAIELNQIIGSKDIIVASAGKVAGADGWKAFADQLTRRTEKLRPLGMATGFHNHQTEWRPFEGDKRPMDILAANTPKDFVLQLDCRHLRRSRRRSRRVDQGQPRPHQEHALKDWGKGEGRGYTVAFGEGDVPWKPLLDAAEAVGGVEYLLDRAGTCRPRRRVRDGASGAWITTRSFARRSVARGSVVRGVGCSVCFRTTELQPGFRTTEDQTKPPPPSSSSLTSTRAPIGLLPRGHVGWHAAERLGADAVHVADLLQRLEKPHQIDHAFAGHVTLVVAHLFRRRRLGIRHVNMHDA